MLPPSYLYYFRNWRFRWSDRWRQFFLHEIYWILLGILMKLKIDLWTTQKSIKLLTPVFKLCTHKVILSAAFLIVFTANSWLEWRMSTPSTADMATFFMFWIGKRKSAAWGIKKKSYWPFHEHKEINFTQNPIANSQQATFIGRTFRNYILDKNTRH